jgi:glutamate dehydrogenase/leucine dehydrogenase
VKHRDSVLATACDVLVLAATSHAIPASAVHSLRCRTIVEAANIAMSPDAEQAAAAAGITVMPDLIASSGGSLSVTAIYESDPRTAQDVLDHVDQRATAAAVAVLEDAERTGRLPRDVCMERARAFLGEHA